ncbi:hypothetical protein HCG49_04125 [Arenibacter sp. 6A1]|uniref:hypothetical protein n=1 Tax=Arenibacter sp. 6A1 TaxID=2720391 RepID=UPI001445C0A3|nr:hypothetical protein [Arenibacter sp. 6A1]NKI25744.1 hypothetical protein [Arenibacter sp. 6A1]
MQDLLTMYTTIMEKGVWAGCDNDSGRIVKIRNAFVFKGAIKITQWIFLYLGQAQYSFCLWLRPARGQYNWHGKT